MGLEGAWLTPTPRTPHGHHVQSLTAVHLHWAPASSGRRRGDRACPFSRQQPPPHPNVHIEVQWFPYQPPSLNRPAHAVARLATSVPASVCTANRPTLPPPLHNTLSRLPVPLNLPPSWRPTSSGTKAWVRALRKHRGCAVVATVRMDLIVLGLGRGGGSTVCSVVQLAMCCRCSVTVHGPSCPRPHCRRLGVPPGVGGVVQHRLDALSVSPLFLSVSGSPADPMCNGCPRSPAVYCVLLMSLPPTPPPPAMLPQSPAMPAPSCLGRRVSLCG